ncbi:MAG: holin, BlyA family protein [Blautia sp.]|nr:holin, BlyA family protein [Blautia sp.]
MDAVYGYGRRRRAKDLLRDFLREEDGLGTIEVVLILLVLIGLVVIFKDQLTSLVGTLLSKVTQQSNSI